MMMKVSRFQGKTVGGLKYQKIGRWSECLFIGYTSESRSGPRDGNNDDDDVEFDDDHSDGNDYDDDDDDEFDDDCSDGNDDDDDDGKVMLAPPASFSLLAFLTASRSWPRPL